MELKAKHVHVHKTTAYANQCTQINCKTLNELK